MHLHFELFYYVFFFRKAGDCAIIDARLRAEMNKLKIEYFELINKFDYFATLMIPCTHQSHHSMASNKWHTSGTFIHWTLLFYIYNSRNEIAFTTIPHVNKQLLLLNRIFLFPEEIKTTANCQRYRKRCHSIRASCRRLCNNVEAVHDFRYKSRKIVLKILTE